ncbi:MAG TPA: hypothetical protein VN181_03415 [Thermoanaerobaculia bacterium]|nr:hypothetical protein [Thermoanaerobaculia bacterium]
MATEKEYQDLLDRLGKLRETVSSQMASQISANPRLAEIVSQHIDDMLNAVVNAESSAVRPPDNGLAALIGLGPGSAQSLGETRLPIAVQGYDETVTSERIVAMADLYYIYQHEQLGVFRAITKLQQLFRAGAVRLSSGEGAYHLYQFDRRGVLRYTRRDRLAAYCRAFGYCAAPPPAGAKPNRDFHHLFTHFMRETSLFWRDKRVSEVIRERASDPSFGSIATVRRAGLDLRNNLKFTSYGHLNVLRVEVMQLLDEAFRVLGAEDIRRLFGADNAWDVVEEVLTRYYNENLSTSPRQRMAVTGREILRWIGQPHILQTARTEFETLLVTVAENVEEWLTSAESLGVSEPRSEGRIVDWKPRAVEKGA